MLIKLELESSKYVVVVTNIVLHIYDVYIIASLKYMPMK